MVRHIQSPSPTPLPRVHAGRQEGSLGTFIVISKTKQKESLKEPGLIVAGSHPKQWNRGTFLVISKTNQNKSEILKGPGGTVPLPEVDTNLSGERHAGLGLGFS